MDTPRTAPQGEAALALFPMDINGMKLDVLPAGTYHGGIPLSVYSSLIKMYMTIGPSMTHSNPLAVHDTVELWVNGKPTSVIKIIKSGEENDTISMELPWGWLNDGANTMFYRVTRSGSHNYGDSVPVLNLLFHYPASTITVSHPPSVDPAQPGTGLCTLTRNYPRAHDEVTLTVGTWNKTIPYVHPANPITYTLTAADLQQIGDGTHPVSARTVDQLGNSSVSPPSSIVIGTAPAEWVDHYTSLADTYNGWIPYGAARSGSIRPHVMSNQTVNAFFNFTDQGNATGFAGVILYQDFLFIPGQYQFTFEGTHVADNSHIQGLVNPILYPDTGMPQWRGIPRYVPKDGVWYVFSIVFTITQKGPVRMYITNDQDSSNGNDFGLRNIRIVRLNGGAGSMSAPAEESELPVYTGPRPEIKYP